MSGSGLHYQTITGMKGAAQQSPFQPKQIPTKALHSSTYARLQGVH